MRRGTWWLVAGVLLLCVPAAPALARRSYRRDGTYDALETASDPGHDWGPMAGGVPLVAYPWGLERNPVTVAQYGLSEWSLWRRGYGRARLRRALRAANWLLSAQRQDGTWAYDFDFAAPGTDMVLRSGWASAMAQGQAMSLLTRVYRTTERRRYLRAARRALRPLRVSVPRGGLARRFPDRSLWFEEYPTPRPSLVLNGDLQTLLGLYDLSDLDRHARRLFHRGMPALIASLPAYDAGGGRSWYDLTQRLGYAPHLAPAGYTFLIQELLRELDDVYPHARLRRYAALWDGGGRGGSEPRQPLQRERRPGQRPDREAHQHERVVVAGDPVDVDGRAGGAAVHERPLAVLADGYADRLHRARALGGAVAGGVVDMAAPQAVGAVVAVLGARRVQRDVEPAAPAAEAVRSAAPGVGAARCRAALVARQAATSDGCSGEQGTAGRGCPAAAGAVSPGGGTSWCVPWRQRSSNAHPPFGGRIRGRPRPYAPALAGASHAGSNLTGWARTAHSTVLRIG
jgi:hypothetical protein